MPELPVNSVLTVSGITELIRDTLEPAFSGVWVQGEVSNLRRQESGHCYFSLKDEGAQLPAVLFRQSAQKLALPLKDGMKVNAYGRISVYAPRGAYQLVCQFVLPAGQGSLAERFEALKRKLEAEGLFDAARKVERKDILYAVAGAAGQHRQRDQAADQQAGGAQEAAPLRAGLGRIQQRLIDFDQRQRHALGSGHPSEPRIDKLYEIIKTNLHTDANLNSQNDTRIRFATIPLLFYKIVIHQILD